MAGWEAGARALAAARNIPARPQNHTMHFNKMLFTKVLQEALLHHTAHHDFHSRAQRFQSVTFIVIMDMGKKPVKVFCRGHQLSRCILVIMRSSQFSCRPLCQRWLPLSRLVRVRVKGPITSLQNSFRAVSYTNPKNISIYLGYCSSRKSIFKMYLRKVVLNKGTG